MTTPLESYQQHIAQGELQADEMQLTVMQALNEIYFELKQTTQWWPQLKQRLRAKPMLIKGLYLWGGVGIGKTLLMDTFYQCLPASQRLRLHFHQFMQQVHGRLTQLQGTKNPLQRIAKEYAKRSRVLCFDEFFVSDIADAMLLAGLLSALFAQGVTLVITSNVDPHDLYKGGISRDRFLPAIKLLQDNMQVMHIPSERDYRMRALVQAQMYFQPLNEQTRQTMRHRFEALSHGNWQENALLIINKRGIPTLRQGHGIVWFAFKDLCNVPRSQLDYLELANSFHTVMVSGIPQLSAKQTHEALYLINLVDVFYDARVKLIVSAACGIDELYVTGQLSFEFERTKSRLHEMQSEHYLHLPHTY